MSRTASTSKSTTPYIYPVTLTTANKAYSQVLPEGTKKFRIYAMNAAETIPHSAVLRYAFESFGDDNWAGHEYIPIPTGNFDENEGLHLSGKTLYFNSPTGSAVVIIKVWK